MTVPWKTPPKFQSQPRETGKAHLVENVKSIGANFLTDLSDYIGLSATEFSQVYWRCIIRSRIWVSDNRDYD
jgi:hypothetical protein